MNTPQDREGETMTAKSVREEEEEEEGEKFVLKKTENKIN